MCDVYGVCRGLKLASIHNGRHWTETLLCSHNVPPVSWDWHPLRPYLFIFSNVWKHYAKERVAQIRCSSCCSIISVGLCLVQQVLHISIIPHVWSGKACLQTPEMMHKCGFLKKSMKLGWQVWDIVSLQALCRGKKRQERFSQYAFKLRDRCLEFYLDFQSIGNYILTRSGLVSHP